MKIEETIRYISAIDRALEARSVEFALVTLEALASACGARFVTSEIERLRESYGLMTTYALDGIVDPQRESLLSDICADIASLSRRCLRHIRMVDDPALYYSTARVCAMRTDEDIASLCAQAQSLSLIPKVGNQTELRRQYEGVTESLFNRVWITSPLTHADTVALRDLLTDACADERLKRHIISAVSLGLLEFHDDTRLTLLADAYEAAGVEHPATAMAALVGLLTGLWVNRYSALRSRTSARLQALTELPHWEADVRIVNLEMARARDTERINKKIRDELIPGILKLKPDIEKRMGSSAVIDPATFDENPEWQELVDKSGLGDKLRELSEIQEEGGDVMMFAMGNLKSLPFFHNVSNWFLPFDVCHSVASASPELARVVEAMPGMADSDRYSMLLAMGMMPVDRREALSMQLKSQSDSIMEMSREAGGIGADSSRRAAASLVVRGAYRFFKQYRRKGEFNDPFASPVSLASLPLTAPVLADADTLALMSEFYFKRGYYAEALELFRRLSHAAPTTAELFQKIGYCLQQSGDIEGALEAYGNSELLKSDSEWTLRRIGACHRMLGHSKEAVDYYTRLAEKRPDDARLALTLGHCLLEDKRPAEALRQYFKAEYLKPDSSRTRRPIAWASLLTGEFDRSAHYYDMILSDAPQSGDYINAGHLEMARGHYREAVERYSRALAMMDFDTSAFLKTLSDDAQVLDSLGVDKFIRGIVSDAVMADGRASGSPLNK